MSKVYTPHFNAKRRRKRMKLSETKRRIIACSQQWKCNLCKNLLDARFDVDHVLSLCLGGTDTFDNLQVLCARCHSKKTMYDNINRQDILKEKRTGKSRFFDLQSCYYINKK